MHINYYMLSGDSVRASRMGIGVNCELWIALTPEERKAVVQIME